METHAGFQKVGGSGSAGLQEADPSGRKKERALQLDLYSTQHFPPVTLASF